MPILTGRGKERKSLSDVPIHLTGFGSPFTLIPLYIFYYTGLKSFVVAGGPDGDFNILAQGREELHEASVQYESSGCPAWIGIVPIPLIITPLHTQLRRLTLSLSPTNMVGNQ